MLKKCLTLVWLTVFSAVLVCCGSSDENIFDAPVHKANAEKTCTMSGISVDLNGDKPNGICGIFVSDSVLLLRGTVKGSPFMVYAYSLNAGSPLGAYIAKGRGPNELLIPQFKEHINESNLLYVFDLSLGSSYSFDYLKSIETHNTVLSELLKLPSRPLYAFPMRKSHAVIIPEADDYSLEILDESGHRIKKLSLYPNVSGEQYFDRLSSACALNQKNSKLAMAMCSSPQVNFIDLENGDKITCAISDEYKKWRDMLNASDENHRLYYMSSAQSSEYFMSLYVGGVSLMDWIKGGDAPHLHIFDWDGNLLFDISLKESLKSITFDGSSKVLYGVDANDNIYRYYMSELM